MLMFQIKPTKPIKSSQSNRTVIGQNTDPNRYASVLIITKSIPICSVTNLKKNQANRIVHTSSLSGGPNNVIELSCGCTLFRPTD